MLGKGFQIPNLLGKYCVALIDFSAPSSPVINILKSTFTGDVDIANVGTGDYNITNSANEFTVDKTVIFASSAQKNGVGVTATFNHIGAGNISMKTFDYGSSLANDPSATGKWSILIMVSE